MQQGMQMLLLRIAMGIRKDTSDDQQSDLGVT